MKNSMLIEWEPITGLSGKFSLEALHDDYEGFRILLRNEDSEMLRLTFSAVVSYRVTDEMYYLMTRGSKQNPLLRNSFYKIMNSDFLRNFIIEMDRLSPDLVVGADHYFISTDFACIDILSEKPPVAEWI